MGRDGTGSLVERTPGNFAMRFYAGRKRQYQTIGRMSKEEAEARLQDTLDQVRRGVWVHPREVVRHRERERSGIAELSRMQREAESLRTSVVLLRQQLRRGGVHAREEAGNISPVRGHRSIAEPIQRAFRELRRKPPKLSNPHEQAAYDEYTRCGWQLYRNGWADFFGISPDGQMVALEVKGPTDRVRPEQADMAALLREAGIDTQIVRVWTGGRSAVTWTENEPVDLDREAAKFDAFLGGPLK